MDRSEQIAQTATGAPSITGAPLQRARNRSVRQGAALRRTARLCKAFLQSRNFPRARSLFWAGIVKPHLAWRDIELDSKTEFGASIPCRSKDLIQRHILFFGLWEPNVGHFIKSQLAPGDLFVDVGANIGYFSMLASQCVGNQGEVVSIEASPSIFHVLQANISNNQCSNIEALNIAAAANPGTVELYAAPGSNLGMTSVLRSRDFPLEAVVSCDRLSSILGAERCSRIRLMKIDIEGAEWPVLKSVLEDISSFNEKLEIVVEINPSETVEFGASASSIFDAFAASGFHAYGIENSYADYLRSRPPQRPQRLRSAPMLCMDIVFSRTEAEFL
jgi:FkbM family methyltransferase